MNDTFHQKPIQLAKVIPKDRSQVLNTSVKKKLKKEHRKNKSDQVKITEIELNLLKMPRQTIGVLESIIETYVKKIYVDARSKQKMGPTLSKLELEQAAQKMISYLLIDDNTGLKAKLIKRDRLRFFAKAIGSGRVNTIEDCYKVAYECAHVNLLNQTRGMVGFILDDLALFYMMLSFSEDMLERFSASFLSVFLDFISHSLVTVAGILQIAAIIKENQPLQLKHYAQICFVSTMTTLGLIGWCTGNAYFGFISSGLSVFRNILILGNEYNEYLKAEPGSDKQMSHKQACIGTLNDILLSVLAITVTAVIMLTPFPGTSLTICIIGITLMKLAWQFLPSTSKMQMKQNLGFGKQEYEEVLNPPIARPVGPIQPALPLVMADTQKPSDKPPTNSAKRKARRKKLALLSSIVVAEPIDEPISENKDPNNVKTETVDEKNIDIAPISIDNDPDPSI